MSRQCLFCPNPVNSKEHVFSNWIIKDLKYSPALQATIGKKASVWIPKPEVKVSSVCATCNNVWMSRLETENKTAIHAMINGDSYSLSSKDQTCLSRWAVMKAMVIDSINRERNPFYDATERDQLKNSIVPNGTLVWLGRLRVKAFHFGGTDIWGEIDKVPKAFHGCVTNIIMGHLVIQVLSGHAPAQLVPNSLFINCKTGQWDVNLLDIWPATESLSWPPSVSFTLSGPDSIGGLISRWKIGTDIG